MMFGMTGAGKSALGNLLAGFEAFASGDDTASVTNLDSVMRYEAPDDSMIVLDTIGLGDTEIDQDKVVGSIRDVALSAVNGVDAMIFVMRNARITDDAIARLIYVTEYLWGSECLLNLYVVVTFGSKYLANRQEANLWVERQVELNWRFKHIYELVGQNPNRFLFIDNPGTDSGEPNVKQRQAASRRAIMMALAQHPRDVIPPFTHEAMQKAKKMVEEQHEVLEKATTKYNELQQARNGGKEVKKRRKSKPRTSLRRNTPQSQAIMSALEEKKKAQQSLQEALIKVKCDADFQRAVEIEAQQATWRFGQDFNTDSLSDRKDGTGSATSLGSNGNPVQACKRMFFSLVNKMGMKGKPPPKPSAKAAGGPKAKASKKKLNAEDIQKALDLAVVQLKSSVRGQQPQAVFKQLDVKQNGTVTPLEFAHFIQKTVQGVSKTQVGGLWRLADRNCDGKLDLQEFSDLLSMKP
ncbi:unnamed protein product [Effrenium voratum]|nr:unnamed protein product [Effrenium voratum]CAJ1432381.1 unnamed protein product [Effrenium voratum]